MSKTDLDKLNDRAFDSFERLKLEQKFPIQIKLKKEVGTYLNNSIRQINETKIYDESTQQVLQQEAKFVESDLRDKQNYVVNLLQEISNLNVSDNIKCAIGILIGSKNIKDIQMAKSYLEKELEEN